MLKAEIKKLISFKVIWILLVCLLCLNEYVIVTKAYNRYYLPSQYKEYLSELKGMTPLEAKEYSENIISNSTENEINSAFLLYDIIEICDQLQTYPDYLDNINKTAENMTSVSIWGGDNTFAYRNIKKTPSAYKNLDPVVLPLDTSLGVEDFLDSPITDVLIIVLLFICVCRIFLHDREQGILTLLYSTPNGRVKLILTKTITAVISGFLLATIFFSEVFLTEYMLYGFGDLSRPIQSVFGYYTSNLAVSVGEYMAIYFALKMLSYTVFTIIFSLICTISKNNLTIYSLSAFICGGSYLLYSKISVLSPLSLLHYLTPIQFLNVKETFGAYTNINVFGYPVSLKSAVLIMILLSCIIFTVLNCIIFAHTRNLQYKSIKLSSSIRFKPKVHSTFYYTGKRILILNKGILVILAAVIISLAYSQSIRRYYDNDEIYYENFCTSFDGVKCSEAKDFIEQKIIAYKEIEEQIEFLEKSDKPSYFKLNELYAKLNDKKAFERFKYRIENTPDNAVIYYDAGYERGFGLNGSKDGIILLLFIMITLVLTISPVMSQDKGTDMIRIIYTTQSGKKGYFQNKLCFSTIMASIITLSVFVPYSFKILSKYGKAGINAPLNSIVSFSSVPEFISVRFAMIILVFIYILVAILSSLIITIHNLSTTK